MFRRKGSFKKLDNIPNFFWNSLISRKNETPRASTFLFVLIAFSYRRLPAYSVPEIDKFNLTRVCFSLKYFGARAKGLLSCKWELRNVSH